MIQMDPDIGNLHAHRWSESLEIRTRSFNRSGGCRSRSAVRMYGPKLRLGRAVQRRRTGQIGNRAPA